MNCERPLSSQQRTMLNYFVAGGFVDAGFAPTLTCVAHLLPSLSFAYDTDTCSPTVGVPVTVVFSFQLKDVSFPAESLTVACFAASSQLVIVPLRCGVDL